MSDASRLRAFLEGWDAADRCLAETLSWVPDEHVVHVVRERERRLGITRNRGVAACETLKS